MPARPSPAAMPIAQPHRIARRRGFTLVELAVVLTILGLLFITMAPHYLRQVYYARRTEALYALRSIHDLESVQYATNDQYSNSFPALGFALDGGSLRSDGSYQGRLYTFTLSAWTLGGQANANYRATATGDLVNGDSILDIVIIENALTVLN